MVVTKKKGKGIRAKKVYDMDKFRKMVLDGKNMSEIKNDMELPNLAAVDQLLLKLCRLDNKMYPELKGGRIGDELTVGKNLTMVLSKAKIERFDWIRPNDLFKIEKDGKNIVLRYIEPETPLLQG